MKSTRAARHRARRFALQALYQGRFVDIPARQIIDEFYEDNDFKRADAAYFGELVEGTARSREALWQVIEPFLDRETDAIDVIEEVILLLGAFELSAKPEIPFRVVLSEAVELALEFGAEGGHKYVNSILDRLAKHYRPVETSPAS